MIAILAAAVLSGAAAAPMSSSDDCAIAVEIGKAELDWGAAPPKPAYFPDPDPGGFHLRCDWRALGVAPPAIGTAQSPSGFSLSAPAYDVLRSHATVDLSRFMRPSFAQVEECKLEKRGGRWKLLGCRTKVIT